LPPEIKQEDCGQGVVYETMHMSELPDYTTRVGPTASLVAFTVAYLLMLNSTVGLLSYLNWKKYGSALDCVLKQHFCHKKPLFARGTKMFFLCANQFSGAENPAPAPDSFIKYRVPFLT
jgi:hypothetical protein